MEYVAFLLGINLGKRSVKMADLKALMEKEGYKYIRTVLASGNVIFDTKKVKPEMLVKKLESAYEKEFGFSIGVIVRTMEEIEDMLRMNPFKKIKVTKNTRRYVMLLAEKPAAPEKPKKLSPEFEVLKVTPEAVYSHLEITDTVKTPDVMKLVGKSYGKKMTTRNWNTIEKIAKA